MPKDTVAVRFPVRAGFVWAIGAAAALAAGGPAHAQSITAVNPPAGGTYAQVDAINASGTAAGGYWSDAGGVDRALRWTSGGGSVSLGFIPGGAINSYVEAMDSTGTILAGYGDAFGPSRAFRWTTGGGYQVLPWVINNAGFAVANGISANGSRVVGRQTIGAQGIATLWDASSPGVSTAIPQLGACTQMNARAISGNGSVVTGECGTSAFRWTQAGGTVSLGALPGQVFSLGEAINTDGSVITGRWSNGNERGYRWTPGTGMVDLGPTPNGGSTVRPKGISGDGNIIVGQCVDPSAGFAAFIWSPGSGVRLLSQVLAARGLNLTGWVLQEATCISPDGTAIGGRGTLNGNPVGFVVTGLTCPVISGTGFTYTVCPGQGIAIPGSSGGACCGNFTWQWFRNGVPLVNGPQPSGSIVVGADQFGLVINNVTAADAGTYYVVGSNAGVCPVQGPSTTLNVYGFPTILNQPVDTQTCVNGFPSFFAAANPTNGFAQYRWQKFIGPQPNIYADIFDGPTGNGPSTYIGTGTTTLLITNAQPADGVRYRCIISDDCGQVTEIVTNRALLTVVPNIAITSQPVDAFACAGDNTATFTVGVNTTVGTTFQWQRFIGPTPNIYADIADGPTPGGGFYSGTQTATLSINGIFPGDAVRHRVVVTGSCGTPNQEVSNRPFLVVVSPPALQTQPVGGLACRGLPKVLTVAPAAGNFGTLTYQWFRKTTPAGPFVAVSNGLQPSGALVSGAQSASLSISGFADGDSGQYYCLATGSCGFVFSNTVTLTSCPVDFNCDGVRTPSDIFAFLNAYFGPCLSPIPGPAPCQYGSADFTGDSTLTPTDIFTFLNAYFAGC